MSLEAENYEPPFRRSIETYNFFNERQNSNWGDRVERERDLSYGSSLYNNVCSQ